MKPACRLFINVSEDTYDRVMLRLEELRERHPFARDDELLMHELCHRAGDESRQMTKALTDRLADICNSLAKQAGAVHIRITRSSVGGGRPMSKEQARKISEAMEEGFARMNEGFVIMDGAVRDLDRENKE